MGAGCAHCQVQECKEQHRHHCNLISLAQRLREGHTSGRGCGLRQDEAQALLLGQRVLGLVVDGVADLVVPAGVRHPARVHLPWPCIMGALDRSYVPVTHSWTLGMIAIFSGMP